MDTDRYLELAVNLFKEELGDHLAGVYLHGSLAMGCFNPDKSDIDLLVVTREKAPAEVYKRLAARIVAFQDSLPNPRGIELSVILETYLTDFVHPTPFEFHFSDFHLERYRQDADYLCGGFEDEDLAAHLTVVYHRGRTLYGTEIHQAFQPVDERFYIQALLYDLEDVQESIAEKPVYYTLNLCRVLLFLQERTVSSKKEGGEWGIQMLPSRYQHLISHCLAEYSGASGDAEFQTAEWTDFAVYMTKEINKLVS